MNPLLAFAAVPAAGAAVDTVKCVASAAARPFADVLGALAGQGDSGTVIPDKGDDHDSLRDRIASRLQEIFESSGSQPGDCASVTFDDATGDVTVNDGAPSGDAAQQAIAADSHLLDDLRAMAEADGESGERLDLLVRVA